MSSRGEGAGLASPKIKVRGADHPRLTFELEILSHPYIQQSVKKLLANLNLAQVAMLNPQFFNFPLPTYLLH